MIKKQLSSSRKQILSAYGIKNIDYSNITLSIYESGEFICSQGLALNQLLIFLNGRAKVFFTSQNGKTLLIGFYSKPGIIGEVELMADIDYASLSVQAITDVTCISISLSKYRAYLKSNTDFVNHVGLSLAKKLNQSTKNSTYNILHPLETRLCAYIAMTSKQGVFKEKLIDVSDTLGTSYRHLLRIIESLCKQGVLEKTSRQYVIKNAAALEKKYDTDELSYNG